MTADRARSTGLHDWALIAALRLSAHFVLVLAVLVLVALAAAVDGWQLLALPFAVAGMKVFMDGLSDEAHLPGREIRPSDEPQLAALVRGIAEQLEVHTALLIRVIPTPDAALISTKVTGARVLVLTLGLPLLRRLTVAQLAAVIARELTLGTPSRRTSHLIAARAELVHSQNQRVHVPAGVATALLRTTQQQCWDVELAADAVSADVAGSGATRGALEQAAALTTALRMFGSYWVRLLSNEGEFPDDFFDAIDAVLDDPIAASRVVTVSRAYDEAEQAAVQDHLPRHVRLAAVPERARRAWDATGPVRLLDGDALERWCVRDFVLPADEPERGGLRGVRILDCAPDHFDRSADSADAAEAALRHATGRELRDDALAAAIGEIADRGWLRLAHRLEPELESEPQEEREEIGLDVYVDVVSWAASARLLRAGWQRASRWLDPQLLVDPDGALLDVRDLITVAVDRGDPMPVLFVLARAGEPRTTS